MAASFVSHVTHLWVAAQVKVQNQQHGYEFSIRTPVTPARWKQFDEVRAVYLQTSAKQSSRQP